MTSRDVTFKELIFPFKSEAPIMEPDIFLGPAIDEAPGGNTTNSLHQ